MQIIFLTLLGPFLVFGQLADEAKDPNKCIVAGDPYFTSFDNRKFEYQGSDCMYLLSAPAPPDTDIIPMEPWAINGRFTTTPDQRSYMSEIVIYFGGHTIIQKANKELKINGQSLSLSDFPKPLSIPSTNHVHGKLTIEEQGNFLNFTFEKYNVTASFDIRNGGGRHVGVIDVTGSPHQNQLVGLCGNWNGEDGDDFMKLGESEPVDDVDVFAKSWGQDCSSSGGVGAEA